MLVGGGSLPSRFDPVAWHIHEMLFGFVMATIAGFLLTAIPNWTGRPPVAGAPLATLAGMWLLGRIACVFSLMIPAWLATLADLAFPLLLAGVVAREILAAQNWRNLPMIAAVSVLGIANLLMHLEVAGISVPTGLGWRLGLAAIIVLISVIGGRIVPSYLNWLAAREGFQPPRNNVAPARHAAEGQSPSVRAISGGSLLLRGFQPGRLLRWRGARRLFPAAGSSSAMRGWCLVRVMSQCSTALSARRRVTHCRQVMNNDFWP